MVMTGLLLIDILLAGKKDFLVLITSAIGIKGNDGPPAFDGYRSRTLSLRMPSCVRLHTKIKRRPHQRISSLAMKKTRSHS